MFETKVTPDEPDAVAPDGSQVKILLGLDRGSMARFELAPGAVSVAVHHRTVEEIWYFVAGLGSMWRRSGTGEEIVAVAAGTCVTIPLGTHFQFRAGPDAPLVAVGVTMPPWPGDGEAVRAIGPWEPTVLAGPGIADDHAS